MPKTYTAAGSATAGEVYTASAHNVIVTNVNNFIVPPLCRVYRGATQSINNASDTFVTWPSEDIDTDGMFTATSDTITIQTAGVYAISCTVIFASNSAGVRALNVLKNATTFDLTKGICINYAAPPNGLAAALSCSTITECSANDTIRAAVYQTSGGALNIGVTDNIRSTALSVAWIGRTT